MSQCKFCGQGIEWITTMEGIHVAVDEEPVFVIEGKGGETFLTDEGELVTGRQAKPEEEAGTDLVAYRAHWKTCIKRMHSND